MSRLQYENLQCEPQPRRTFEMTGEALYWRKLNDHVAILECSGD
jgi:hypothetical protein